MTTSRSQRSTHSVLGVLTGRGFGSRVAAVIAIGSLLTVGLGVADAVSAATSGHGYKACATKSGVLSVESHGHCARGTHKVAVGARGATGAKGATGAAGPSFSLTYQLNQAGNAVGCDADPVESVPLKITHPTYVMVGFDVLETSAIPSSYAFMYSRLMKGSTAVAGQSTDDFYNGDPIEGGIDARAPVATLATLSGLDPVIVQPGSYTVVLFGNIVATTCSGGETIGVDGTLTVTEAGTKP